MSETRDKPDSNLDGSKALSARNLALHDCQRKQVNPNTKMLTQNVKNSGDKLRFASVWRKSLVGSIGTEK